MAPETDQSSTAPAITTWQNKAYPPGTPGFNIPRTAICDECKQFYPSHTYNADRDAYVCPKPTFKESQTASGLVVVEKAQAEALPWYAPHASELDWFFPEVDPQHEPMGNKIIVQLKRTRQKTDSGVILVEETKSDEKWNTQIAKVISLGSIAYCNRSTGEPWPEGAWAKPGDFIRVPRWGGDRWIVKLKDEAEEVTFCLFNDHEASARVTGDPLAVRIYIL